MQGAHGLLQGQDTPALPGLGSPGQQPTTEHGQRTVAAGKTMTRRTAEARRALRRGARETAAEESPTTGHRGSGVQAVALQAGDRAGESPRG